MHTPHHATRPDLTSEPLNVLHQVQSTVCGKPCVQSQWSVRVGATPPLGVGRHTSSGRRGWRGAHCSGAAALASCWAGTSRWAGTSGVTMPRRGRRGCRGARRKLRSQSREPRMCAHTCDMRGARVLMRWRPWPWPWCHGTARSLLPSCARPVACCRQVHRARALMPRLSAARRRGRVC